MSEPQATVPATEREPQATAPPPAPPPVNPNVVYVPASKKSEVSSSYDVVLYFVAIFVPPLPVLLKRGPGADFCINILLWIFGWIPGVIHSWYIIAKTPGHV